MTMAHGVVIGLASVQGGGKGELVKPLVFAGAEHFHLGTVVRDTARANGFVPEEETREAYLPFWKEYSADYGENWLAKLAMAHAQEKEVAIVVDGVRIAADAGTIAEVGTMFWMHTDLRAVAERVVRRAREEDQNTTTVEECIESMESDLAGTGHFSMGTVRDLCTVHLLPVPEIEDETARAEAYRAQAMFVLETSGARERSS